MIFLILGFLNLFGSSFLLAGQFDEQKTKELKECLSSFLVANNDANKKADKTTLSLTIKRLIEERADPDTESKVYCNNYGFTAIHFAAEVGDVDLIEFLAKFHVDINVPCSRYPSERYPHYEKQYPDKWTPLIFAARNGHESAVAKLVKLNANIEYGDHYNWTALMHAVGEGHAASVARLIELGANIGAISGPGYYTAIILAAIDENEEVVIKLLNFGANADKDLIKRLLIDRNKISKIYASCFLEESKILDEYWLHKMIRESSIDWLRKILPNLTPDFLKISINQQTLEGLTPLDIALARHDKEAILLLLTNGADPLAGRINGLLLTSKLKEWPTNTKEAIYQAILMSIPQLKTIPKDIIAKISQWFVKITVIR